MSNKQFIDDDNLFDDDDFFGDESKEEVVVKEIIDETKKETEEKVIPVKNEQPFKKQENLYTSRQSVENTNNKPVENKIPVKPKIEIRKKKEINPYKDRYKRETPVKKNNTNKKEKLAVKKLISISQKNLQVVDILKKINKDYPSESEFICQAIVEKYKRDKENSEKDLKTLVKETLEELVGEKYIILKGSSDIAISNNPTPSVPQLEVNNSIKVKEKEENQELLKGIMSSWDIE